METNILILIAIAIIAILLLPFIIRFASASFALLVAIGLFVLLAGGVFTALGIALPPDLFSRIELMVIGGLLALGIVLMVLASNNPKARRAAISYLIVVIICSAGFGLLKLNM